MHCKQKYFKIYKELQVSDVTLNKEELVVLKLVQKAYVYCLINHMLNHRVENQTEYSYFKNLIGIRIPALKR